MPAGTAARPPPRPKRYRWMAVHLCLCVPDGWRRWCRIRRSLWWQWGGSYLFNAATGSTSGYLDLSQTAFGGSGGTAFGPGGTGGNGGNANSVFDLTDLVAGSISAATSSYGGSGGGSADGTGGVAGTASSILTLTAMKRLVVLSPSVERAVPANRETGPTAAARRPKPGLWGAMPLPRRRAVRGALGLARECRRHRRDRQCLGLGVG